MDAEKREGFRVVKCFILPKWNVLISDFGFLFLCWNNLSQNNSFNPPLHYFQVIVSGKILEEKNHFELTTHFILKSKVSYLDNWARMWLSLNYLKAVPTIMKRINSVFLCVYCLWYTHDTKSVSIKLSVAMVSDLLVRVFLASSPRAGNRRT